MRKSVVFAASVLAFCSAAASTASAQWAPLGGRLTVAVNGAIQPGSQDLDRTTTFTLYDENAEVTTAQKIQGGGVFDIGAAYRIRKNIGLGVSYSFMRSVDPGTITGSLPHPIFFDQPRTFSTITGDLVHKEHVVHVQAIYYIPFVDKVDFSVFAGPSFFTVTQGFARGVTFSEQPPDFRAVTIDTIDTVEVDKSGVGFNIGAEGTYAITRMIGAGAMVRYTRASLDFDLGEGQTAAVKAGNFQLGAGLRLRF
jgi:hypothetical protein